MPRQRRRLLRVDRGLVVETDHTSGPEDRLSEPPHAEEEKEGADYELQGREWDPLQRRADRQGEDGKEKSSGASADEG